MCLVDLCKHLHHAQVSNPMDLATLLMRVDQRRYPTLAAFMADLQGIATATQQYWAGEARGAREVQLCILPGSCGSGRFSPLWAPVRCCAMQPHF